MRNKDIIALFGCHLASRSCKHLLKLGHFGLQVHLSAVIPTVPVDVCSSASTALEQPLAGLSVSSNPTAVISNLQTGTLSSLTVQNILFKLM